ncbi:hypothetical protein [Sphingomonas sp. Leaf242]|uniref:hypothetical protein n=1 Tax=Sphingomonas sp. Leaf242 TaxID=1736304 RepID=UPI0012E1BE49|nr:hypothetical protein [Sphingomonas sp. Leaf242]
MTIALIAAAFGCTLIAAPVRHRIDVTIYAQQITDPGYDRDRGAANVLAMLLRGAG